MSARQTPVHLKCLESGDGFLKMTICQPQIQVVSTFSPAEQGI
jgi:hypothetical protein